MKRKKPLEKGDIVKLRNSVKNHKCPEGRIDNKTAEISGFFDPSKDNSMDGVIMVDDLEGCKFWNISDLAIVRRVEKEKAPYIHVDGFYGIHDELPSWSN